MKSHTNYSIICVDDEEGILASYKNILAPEKDSFDDVFEELFEERKDEPVPSNQSSSVDDLHYYLLLARSGREAVELVKAELIKGNRIAAGFFDMRMPGGMDGYETIKIIKELDSDIYCAVVTAYTDRKVDQIRKLFHDKHQDELLYFQKPFGGEELQQTAFNMVKSWNRKRDEENYVEVIKRNHEGLEFILKAVQELALLPPRSLPKMLSGVLNQLVTFSNAENGFIVLFDDDENYWMGTTVGRFEEQDLARILDQYVVTQKSLKARKLCFTEKASAMPLIYCDRLVGIMYIERRIAFGDHANEVIFQVFQNQMVPLILNSMFYDEILSKEHEVLTDPLTGLYNRRFIMKWYVNNPVCTQVKSHPISILMMDIDDFKNINDTYGHDIGDKVLKNLGNMLYKLVRSYDIIKLNVKEVSGQEHYAIRYGGEEFVIILTHTDSETALKVAERIRAQIAAQEHNTPETSFHITVSIGVGMDTVTSENSSGNGKEFINSIISKADKALYKAKSEGKNRVELFQDS